MRSSKRDSKSFASACRRSVIESYAALNDDALGNIEKSPDFASFIMLSNALTNDVQYDILKQRTPEQRAKIIGFYVEVIRESLLVNDFYNAGTILGSLNAAVIFNLPETQNNLPVDVRKFLADLVYFLKSGKTLAESEVAKGDAMSGVIPNMAALKSLYIAFAETINQNKQNIFQNWLKAESPKPGVSSIVSPIHELLGRGALLARIEDCQSRAKGPQRVRDIVQAEVEALFREYLEAYKKNFPHRKPAPTDAEQVKVAMIDYDRDIKGKVVKIVDAAFSINGLVAYAKNLRSNLAKELNVLGPDVHIPDPKATPERIDDLFKKYSQKEKGERVSLEAKSEPGDILQLHEVGQDYKIAFLEAELRSQQKRLEDSQKQRKSVEPDLVEQQAIASIKELRELLGNFKNDEKQERKWRAPVSRRSVDTTSNVLKSLLGGARSSPVVSRRGSSAVESSDGISSGIESPNASGIEDRSTLAAVDQSVRPRAIHTAQSQPLQREPIPVSPATKPKISARAVAKLKAPPAPPEMPPLVIEFNKALKILSQDFNSESAIEQFKIIKASDLSDQTKKGCYGRLHKLAESVEDKSGLIGLLRAAINPSPRVRPVQNPETPAPIKPNFK